MAKLNIRAKRDCAWDLISLGEVMLRLDPGDERISTTRHFRAWEGGGEYNVARGLKRCFGMDTAIVTAFADNPVGRLVEDLMLQGGVGQKYVRWAPYDGVGRTVRNGLNFTERGFGIRPALGCSDRGHTAVSQLKPGEIDWGQIFSKDGARWFHTGGIFCALSETTPLVAQEAMEAAKRAGAVVSYDLNYRSSLWKSIGGKAKAQGRILVAHPEFPFFRRHHDFGVGESQRAVGSANAVNVVGMKVRYQCDIDTLGSTPAAARFCMVRPTAPLVGSKLAMPLPLSTRTSLPPVLTSCGLNEVVTMPFGM